MVDSKIFKKLKAKSLKLKASRGFPGSEFSGRAFSIKRFNDNSPLITSTVRSSGFLRTLKTARKSTTGFSLVEAIVYIGLLVLVLAAIISMLLIMGRSYNYLKSSRHIQTSAVTVLDRIIRDVRNAQSISVGQSTLGTTPGILTLNTTTVSGAPQTIQFYVSGGVVRVKQDGVDVGPLTLPDVNLGSLIFRQITTGISSAVKIELTLETGAGPSARSANFYGTAILRDSY